MVATPKHAADDVLKRARALLDLANNAPSGTSITTKMDLRRTAVANGMAALDTYMHWAVRRATLQPGSRALRKLEVSLGDLIDSSQRSIEARAQGTHDRPMTRVRNVLNSRILAMTFQSPKGFEDAMQMLGVKSCWTLLSAHMQGAESGAELRVHLGRLYEQRNMVVHEGDLRRLLRPQIVDHHERYHKEVKEMLDWISAFIDAVDLIVETAGAT